MMPSTGNTDFTELMKFHILLTKSAPKGFYPFYFPIEPNGKEPLQGKSWKFNQKTLQEACWLMKKGHNIGICATEKNSLCIVDRDDLIQVPNIKPTLQITSRKRIGKHNYYFAVDGTAKKNIATRDAGEVRACWQYVLTPGSFVPCSPEEINRMPEHEKPFAGRYTLDNDLSATEITFEELPNVYKARYEEIRSDEIQAVIRTINKKPANVNKGGKYRSALWDLDITDVSGVRDTGGRYIPMPSEIHGSETGHNCKVSNGLMHCWRHSNCHNGFSYLCMLAGIASCERAGKPHAGRGFGVDAQDGETVFRVWKYAKDRGLIPENDPIPRSALVYYAIYSGCCKKEDVIDGWKLPEINKVLTIIKAKQEGINLGRN